MHELVSAVHSSSLPHRARPRRAAWLASTTALWAVAASAAPIELFEIRLTHAEVNVNGSLAAVEPYEASIGIDGANIDTATLVRPGSLGAVPLIDDELEFQGAIDVLDELPGGMYSLLLTGTMGDMATIDFVATLPSKPSGLPQITSPIHLAATTASTTLQWDCSTCVADELFVEVGDETLDEDAFIGFFPVDSEQVALVLDPTHVYEYDVELSNLLSDATQGDFLLVQRYRVENEVVTTPEPSTACLLLAGLIGLARRKRARAGA